MFLGCCYKKWRNTHPDPGHIQKPNASLSILYIYHQIVTVQFEGFALEFLKPDHFFLSIPSLKIMNLFFFYTYITLLRYRIFRIHYIAV